MQHDEHSVELAGTVEVAQHQLPQPADARRSDETGWNGRCEQERHELHAEAGGLRDHAAHLRPGAAISRQNLEPLGELIGLEGRKIGARCGEGVGLVVETEEGNPQGHEASDLGRHASATRVLPAYTTILAGC